MESLEVNNFLTIKEAHVVVRRFTIMIGPQANGKSLIAKLLYFFRNFLNTHYMRSIKKLETRPQLKTTGIAYFEAIFPKYTWLDQNFELVYTINETSISLSRDPRLAQGIINFSMSEDLLEAHRKAKLLLKRKSEEITDEENIRAAEILFDVHQEAIYDTPLNDSFQRSVFIPASRSFFANLQKNVFSFLANNIAIDPLIKEFGSAYETSKIGRLRRPASGDTLQLRDEINQQIEGILVGRYVHQDDQDWIISDRRKINLANASSGQQEVLPLLLVLSSWVQRTSRLRASARTRRGPTFFIEEPEAHLFPVSQRRLVGILARLYAELGYNFVLTTHSPYVLTALNNLIMASNLLHEKGEKVSKKVQEAVGQNSFIKFEDVSAYTIRNGKLEDILDLENKLIGSTVIDSVSDEFDRVFDALMQIELT